MFHLPTRILLLVLLLQLPQIYWAYRLWLYIGASTEPRKWLRRVALLVLGLLQIPWLTLFRGRSEAILPLPDVLLGPYRMVSAVWSLGALAAFLGLVAFRSSRFAWRRFVPPGAAPRDATPADPARRRFLETAVAGLGLAPWLVVTYGVSAGRMRHRVERVSVAIPDLPPAFDGLRLLQLTDIHVSEDMPPALIERFVEVASGLDADLGILTGDYLAFDQWGLEECVAALSRVQTRLGIVGCLGNHEIHTGASNRITSAFERRGVDILRGEGRDLERDGSRLRLVGVDYQRSRGNLLVDAEKLMRPGLRHVLLSHNPNVLLRAAELGFDLILAGHTHGGQVRVEILEREISASQFISPYVQGLYRQGAAQLYVSRGIGTTGLPIRLGAPPEITMITLKRA